MPQITVTLTFDSAEAALAFLANPTLPVSKETAAIGLVGMSTSDAHTAAPISTLTTTAAPSVPDPEAVAKSVHSEMNEMIKRFPSGAGAAKAKEILNKHGLARIRDLNGDADKAALLILAFKVAA